VELIAPLCAPGWFCEAAASPCCVALVAVCELCVVLVVASGLLPFTSPDCGKVLDCADVLLWVSALAAGGMLAELCELIAPVPVADCAVAPVWLLRPALWFVVLSAFASDCGWFASPVAAGVELEADELLLAPMVPVEAEPPEPLTVKCSRTLFTPGTLFARSFALLRSALLGTDPLSVARPLLTETFTFENSGFDASWSLICLVSWSSLPFALVADALLAS
jgi:hypothetical protein